LSSPFLFCRKVSIQNDNLSYNKEEYFNRFALIIARSPKEIRCLSAKGLSDVYLFEIVYLLFVKKIALTCKGRGIINVMKRYGGLTDG